jgi:hypothetical protein
MKCSEVSEYPLLLALKSSFSLENFMHLIADEEFYHQSRIDRPRSANEWIKYYETARKSYVEFGGNPPLGPTVRTLRAEYGGSGNDKRTLHEDINEKYANLYFNLRGPNSNGLSLKATWFLDFKVSNE